MSTFRELFDENERNDIVTAMLARRTYLHGMKRQANRRETVPNQSTLDSIDERIERTDRIIKTLNEETF